MERVAGGALLICTGQMAGGAGAETKGGSEVGELTWNELQKKSERNEVWGCLLGFCCE